jgi:hypothetical protein
MLAKANASHEECKESAGPAGATTSILSSLLKTVLFLHVDFHHNHKLAHTLCRTNWRSTRSILSSLLISFRAGSTGQTASSEQVEHNETTCAV